MRKLFIISLLVCFCFQLVGQTQVGESDSPIFFKNGKVGIGNSDPLAKLHITNGNYSYGAILAQADESSFQLYVKSLTTQPTNVESFRLGLKHGSDENNGYISFYRGGSGSGGFLGFATSGIERMRIVNNGNIGIGTASPLGKLDVRGNVYISSGIGDNHIYWGSHNMTMGTRPGDYAHNVFKLKPGGADQGFLFSVFQMYTASSKTEQIQKVQIHSSGSSFFNGGNVGIGTDAPDTKLDVRGTIKATEIKVQAQTADFVFEEDYQLKSLEEVEQFVQENKHLPDIPSAKQMEEEGVGLAEMNKLLLQKVEELMLYTIQQDKILKGQQKQIQEQELQIKAFKNLEERMSALERNQK